MPSLKSKGSDTREILFGLDAKNNSKSVKCPICSERISVDLTTFTAHIISHMKTGDSHECPICIEMRSRNLSFYRTSGVTISSTNQVVLNQRKSVDLPKKPHKPPSLPKSLRKSTKRTALKVPKLPTPATPKIEPEEIPYLFDRSEKRKGTSNWPYLYSIVKTKSSPGRWFTAVTFIMEMDGKFYHVRKDGIGNDINQIHMKCNNGVRQCKWKGLLHRKDRQLTANDVQFYNPESYTVLEHSTEEHLAQCIENAHENEPTAEEASSLPQNIEVDILKSVSDMREREAAQAAKALSLTLPRFQCH
ncbi:Oidioi.mRNA.OKI2018_I69.chr2.g5644.t1.cds [Oikopleura dioica]|uniref:Oidioi.mRNA.OKI2018_I69.chr2.g5644.t1.cds n=1 Tax=Oikopleura dioica TaxID=34765 RepID=A0ABN7T5B7_OIKDI|nr:Oidioi.mRNA.OKI2018_I69.chr2.g5644.t1.cds [Oikopleura dioica]